MSNDTFPTTDVPDDEEMSSLFDVPTYVHYNEARNELSLDELTAESKVRLFAYEGEVESGDVTVGEFEAMIDAIDDAGVRCGGIIFPDVVQEDMPLADSVAYEVEAILNMEPDVDVESLVDRARKYAAK
jgi:hypothetical protein